MEQKKTYGQTVVEHYRKDLPLEDDPREYSRAMGKDLWAEVKAVADEAKILPAYHQKNFYVVVLHNVERIGNVPRNRVFTRQSCPTPVYKQSVWKYHRNSGDLEFLWNIPDMFRYYDILKNSAKYLENPSERQRAQFVILMEEGKLLDWVKKENGEKQDAVIKVVKEQND